MNKEAAFKAMMQGHKIAHSRFTDEEYLHIVNGVITSEDGYNFEKWWHWISPGEEWKLDNWSIVKICYECGKHVYPKDEFTFNYLNYAHTDCLKG